MSVSSLCSSRLGTPPRASANVHRHLRLLALGSWLLLAQGRGGEPLVWSLRVVQPTPPTLSSTWAAIEQECLESSSEWWEAMARSQTWMKSLMASVIMCVRLVGELPSVVREVVEGWGASRDS